MTRLRPTTLLLAASIAVATSSSAAAQSDPGLFSVSPARQIVTGGPPHRLQPYSVSNTTKQALKVLVIPGVLDQKLSGEVYVKEDQDSLRDAAKILVPSVDHFVLQPGQSRTVGVDWRMRPIGDRVLNMGVVFQSTAATNSSSVTTVQRLLTMGFLQLPGAHRSTGRFISLRAQQGADKTLDLIPRIENTGDVAQSPQRGKVVVRDATNAVVFKAPFVGDVILPGHQRDFPLNVKKVLPAGEYKMSATADFGSSRHIHIVSGFKLVGPNELPSPHVTIEQLIGDGDLGGNSHVDLTVHSVGTAAADTSVKVQLYKLTPSGQRPQKPMNEKKFTVNSMQPGKKKQIRVPYPNLPRGNYRAIVTYRDTPDTVARMETDFAPKKPAADKGSSIAPILGAIGGLVTGLLLFFWWRRRRRKRDEEQVPAPVPTPPMPDYHHVVNGRVNVNLANLEQLQLLPGIGPKAAERIIEYREEYGNFESLDDLGLVHGIAGQRLAALEDRVKYR